MALSPPSDPVVLSPSYGVSLGVVGLGVACLALLPLGSWALWVALAVSLFGLFLVLQTALLRLQFDGQALVVRRGGEELRRFPYDDWLAWRLFWPGLPVLFYFRERRSIHLLPVLFDASGLREQLQQRLPRLSATPSLASASSQDHA
ncbi:DUF3119 family protein [Cyanobium sp. CH-040]|uniref:DUF3119 family protein n=1 Tax=Cyanobium sp. CH-040 TaxID=2823708 RepID=UPI0020CFD95B|nr:DUF3119 family protein [Cyanobium sp. CH-040]MCP9926280.1 DUF3119 family protein [Cyanobium sp. CH-040]